MLLGFREGDRSKLRAGELKGALARGLGLAPCGRSRTLETTQVTSG